MKSFGIKIINVDGEELVAHIMESIGAFCTTTGEALPDDPKLLLCLAYITGQLDALSLVGATNRTVPNWPGRTPGSEPFAKA